MKTPRLTRFWWSSPLWLAALLLMSTPVMAQPSAQTTAEATLSWEAPTEREDGTSIDPSEIASYRIYHTVDADMTQNPEAPHTVVSGEQDTQVVSVDLMPRPHEPYVIRFGVRAVDTEGRMSDLSNIEAKTVTVRSTSKLKAPVQLRFELVCTGCTLEVTE